MKVNRKELLEQLESILPGLSTREIIEQSSSFIFQNEKVMTYNDEVACIQKSCLHIEGSVVAMPFISILRKLEDEKDEELEISVKKKVLLIRGSHKKVGIKMDAEILLPIDSIKKPKNKKWKKLPSDFIEAIKTIQHCAGRDETRFALTCIHLTSDWIEASDGYQAARQKIKMNIEKPTLVRKESIKHIIDLDVIEFSETKNWIYFRNSSGLVLSCRCWSEKFPELTELLSVKGTPIQFPKDMTKAVEKARIFSVEDVEDNQVTINLEPNKLRIIGKGASGYYQEDRRVKYKGKDLSFRVATDLFTNLLQRHAACKISANSLKVSTKKYIYITVLQITKD